MEKKKAKSYDIMQGNVVFFSEENSLQIIKLADINFSLLLRFMNNMSSYLKIKVLSAETHTFIWIFLDLR